MKILTFKDFEIGKEFDFGYITLSEQEIIDFAINYDPLDFHTNKEIAEKSMFKGLIASGPHAFSVFYKTQCLPMYKDTIIGGLEVTYKFLKPIYADKKIFGKITIADIKTNYEKIYATVKWSFILTNEKDELLQTVDMTVLHNINK